MADSQNGPANPAIPKAVPNAPAPRKHRATKKKEAAPAAPAAPMTSEDFSEEMAKLTARARADGVDTLRATLGAVAKRAFASLDNILGAIEEGNSKKTAKK